jgi:lipopolysaccharide transport system ATP-binding protein
MLMRDAIIVENLGKRYSRRNSNRPRTIHEAVTRGLRGLRPKEHFWALRELSFRVRRGSMLGVIGRNGAGKSTLLRMLGAVDIPNEGSVKTSGRVGALLTLGAGFHPDLTGRENVFISGVVHGLTRSEVQKRFDAIVEFSEIKDFIDDPVRIYSSGMQMRLRFAVAIHMEPEVLLIDEVLSVGDASFECKCRDRIDRFRSAGCTVVLISHGLDQVREMCDEAIWLESGRLAEQGAPNRVIDRYLDETSGKLQAREANDTHAVRDICNVQPTAR